MYFENLLVDGKNLTIEGNYNFGCTAKEEGETRIEGSAGSGSVFDISDSTVVLKDIGIEWGANLAGGGILAGNSNVTLDNVVVSHNWAWGGAGRQPLPALFSRRRR